MEDFNCEFLPEIFSSDAFSNFNIYQNYLYEIFKRDFLNNDVYYNNKKVKIRDTPFKDGYEHGFIHLTTIQNENTKDINNRKFDPERAKRISWVKPIIENNNCNKACCRKKIYI